MDIREKDDAVPVNPSLKNLLDLYGIELGVNGSSGELIIARVLPYQVQTHGGMLQAGDVVVEMNSERVRSLDDAAAIFRRDRYYLHAMSVVRQGRVFQVRFQNR